MDGRASEASQRRQFSSWLFKRKNSLLAHKLGVGLLNKRYVTIDFDHHILYYAHSPTSRRVSVPIPFSSLVTVTDTAATRRSTVLDLLVKKIGRVETEHPIVIKTDQQVIELYADSTEEKKHWVSALQLALEGGRSSMLARIRNSEYYSLANPKDTSASVAQAVALDGSTPTAPAAQEDEEAPPPPTPLPFFDVPVDLAPSLTPTADETVPIEEKAQGAIYEAADLGFEEEDEDDSRRSASLSSSQRSGRARVSRVDTMVGRSTHERMLHLEFSDTASASSGEIDDGSEQSISATPSPSAAQYEPVANAVFKSGVPSCGPEIVKAHKQGADDEEQSGNPVIVETSFISTVKTEENLKAAAPLECVDANVNNMEDYAPESAVEENSANVNENNVALWMKTLHHSTPSVDVHSVSEDGLEVPILGDLLTLSNHVPEAECKNSEKRTNAPMESSGLLEATRVTSIESVELSSKTSDSAEESSEETEKEVHEKEDKLREALDGARLLHALPAIPDIPAKGKSEPSGPNINYDIDAKDTLMVPEKGSVWDDAKIDLKVERRNEVDVNGVRYGEHDVSRVNEKRVEEKGPVEEAADKAKPPSLAKDDGRGETTLYVQSNEAPIESVELQSEKEEEDEAFIISANEREMPKQMIRESEIYVAECDADLMRIEDADDAFAQYGPGEEEPAPLCGVLPHPREQGVREMKETLLLPTPLKQNGFMENITDKCFQKGSVDDARVSSEEDKKKACFLETHDTIHVKDAQSDVFPQPFFKPVVHAEGVNSMRKGAVMEESVRAGSVIFTQKDAAMEPAIVENVGNDPFRAIEEKIHGHQDVDDVFGGFTNKNVENCIDESTYESSTVAMQVSKKYTNSVEDFVDADLGALAVESVDDYVGARSNQDDSYHDATPFEPEPFKLVSESGGSHPLMLCEQVEDLSSEETITPCDAVSTCETNKSPVDNLGSLAEHEVDQKKDVTARAPPVSKEGMWSADGVAEQKLVSENISVPECFRPAVNAHTCISKYKELLDDDMPVRHKSEVPRSEDHGETSEDTTSADASQRDSIPRRAEFEDASRRDVTRNALTESDVAEDADSFVANTSPQAHTVSHTPVHADRGFDFFDATSSSARPQSDVHMEDCAATSALPPHLPHAHGTHSEAHVNDTFGPHSDGNGLASARQVHFPSTHRGTAELDTFTISKPAHPAASAHLIVSLSDKEDDAPSPGTHHSVLPPSLPRLLPPPTSAVPLNHSYDQAALGIGAHPTADNAVVSIFDSSTSSDEDSNDLTQRAPTTHYSHIEQLHEHNDERSGLLALC